MDIVRRVPAAIIPSLLTDSSILDWSALLPIMGRRYRKPCGWLSRHCPYGEGHFTGGGHFLLLCNIDARNEVFVADPKSVENTEKLWPLDTILAEAKTSPTTNGALLDY